MKPFDPNKPVQTRDGRPVVIHTCKLRGVYKILATVYSVDIDSDNVFCYYSDGRRSQHRDQCVDLVNVPQKLQREVWINFYPNNCLATAYSKAQADSSADPMRTACKRFLLEFEEGEGL